MQTAQFHGSVKWFKSYRYLKIQDGCHPAATILDLKKLNTTGNIPCGFEVGHQILRGSVKQFNSYRDFKNPRWPPPCGRHLGFKKIEHCDNIPCGSEVSHQISKVSV
jgi:hypothetical protein